jgi:hypothetical protein
VDDLRFEPKANLLKGEFASLLSEALLRDPCDALEGAGICFEHVAFGRRGKATVCEKFHFCYELFSR